MTGEDSAPEARFSVRESWNAVGTIKMRRAVAAQARPPGTNWGRPLRTAKRQERIRAMGHAFLGELRREKWSGHG